MLEQTRSSEHTPEVEVGNGATRFGANEERVKRSS